MGACAVLCLLAPVGLASAASVATSSPADMRRAVLALAEPLTSRGATVAIYVLDTRTSEILINSNGEKPLRPASCNKLLTTAAGLTLLGRDFRFVTELYTTGTTAGETLRGSLVVRGGGDPTISGRFEADKRDVAATPKAWAAALRANGIRTIEGDLVADDRIFDREFFHPFWYPRERGEWYEAEVWGLSFNDNCVDLSWSAVGKLPGTLLTPALNPPTKYVNIRSGVTVAARGRESGRTYFREETSNDILATGTLTVDTEKEDSASVHDGARYFLTVFREALTSEGITVNGLVRLVRPDEPVDYAPERLLARRESPPLDQVCNVINRNSQNFYAECLLKMLGRRLRGEGSFAAGCSVVMDFCRERGLYHEGHRMVDGSGLSPENYVSARQLVEVIALMDGGTLREVWRETLPIGGKRGTLRARFEQDDASKAAAGRIYGKTGLIGGVRSIAGIVTNAAGREMYYCVNVNGFRGGADRVMEFIDDAVVTLARSEF
ncbi:MAG: D-alanyl-D-alanine carboxypeptidase/D-alanyl-D-alanine-endopeptidase [Candidatus Sumerlaeaceae bacterium]|nr:D-alanyl-D-alanine carboxypeptidase/D-alanyl-D-alanine-endopeptidase [Candidatus Sumerlaeaceae bacterium]